MRDGIRNIYKCAITECAHFTNPTLSDRVRCVVGWLDETWREAVLEVHEATGKLRQKSEPLKSVAAYDARALGDLSKVLAAWQMREEVVGPPQLPSSDDLRAAAQRDRNAGQT